jgi:hypothetical protein
LIRREKYMFINKNNEKFIKELAIVKKIYTGVLYGYIKPNTSVYRNGHLIPSYNCGNIMAINDGSIINGFTISFNINTPVRCIIIVKDGKIDDVSFRFLSFIKFNDKNLAKYIKDIIGGCSND